MDNFRIDITSEGREQFKRTFELLRSAAPGGKVESYCLKQAKEKPGQPKSATLGRYVVLYWVKKEELDSKELRESAVNLPYIMTLEEAADLFYGTVLSLDYGPEPDHDGDNGQGWRIYNEAWGHVDDSPYAICAIEPAWAMYGK